MIQDISPAKYNVTYYTGKEPEGSSLAVVKHGGKILVSVCDGTVSFPRVEQVKNFKKDFIYLFSVDQDEFYYAPDESEIQLPGFSYEVPGIFRAVAPKSMAFAGITACQFASWYSLNKFCGRCGAVLHHDGVERMMRCDRCGNMIFPRISPAVIVAVTDGDRLLMTRPSQALRPGHGYALVSGFVEVGEPIEDTVRREVMEETGVRVKNLRFYKSQPWSFSDSLLMGFFCELDGSDKITVQQSELSDAKWVRRDEIETVYNDMSLTNEMICLFKDGKIG